MGEEHYNNSDSEMKDVCESDCESSDDEESSSDEEFYQIDLGIDIDIDSASDDDDAVMISEEKSGGDHRCNENNDPPDDHDKGEYEYDKILKKGDTVDVMAVLSSHSRDYLVRSNGDRVRVDSLKGKIIVLLNIFHPEEGELSDCMCAYILEVYPKLYGKGNFEVVMVSTMVQGKQNNRVFFDRYFSNLPWLAVPYQDSETGTLLRKLLWDFAITVLDGHGKVLSADTMSFLDYGPELCYPFTAERMQELQDEDKAVLGENFSLDTLLGSPTRNFLVATNDESKRVLLSDINNKLVCLYLCYYNHISSKLMKMYNRCRARGLDFEVVLVDVRFLQNGYDKCAYGEFAGMPWLALPFWDKSSRWKQWRLFNGCPDDQLVLVGPQGIFLETNAEKVIFNFGIAAYPFTRKRVAKNEKARLRAVTLETLLVFEDRDYVINNKGVQFPVSSLKGRNIFLFLGYNNEPQSGGLCNSLVKWYHEIKAKDAVFEIIYVSFSSDVASFSRCFDAMPWLAIPFDRNHSDFVCTKFTLLDFGCESCDTILAFGCDGRLVSWRAEQHLEDRGSDAYPFTESTLYREIKREVMNYCY